MDRNTLPHPAPNRPISSQRRPRAAIHILESKTSVEQRAGRAAGKQCARLANCANVDLPNSPIMQTRKSALALIFIWATVRLGNCRIAPLPDCLFVEFHTWAFRGFNSFVLYGILVFVIRFNVYFL